MRRHKYSAGARVASWLDVHDQPWNAPSTVELLAGDGVTVGHNPVSNLKLGACIAPVPAYLAAGVSLALGTDSMASNNSADLFEEIKIGALLQRGIHHDPARLNAGQTFAMATSGGARALRPGLSGRLAVGEPADLILLDTTGPAATPMPDPIAYGLCGDRSRRHRCVCRRTPLARRSPARDVGRTCDTA